MKKNKKKFRYRFFNALAMLFGVKYVSLTDETIANHSPQQMTADDGSNYLIDFRAGYRGTSVYNNFGIQGVSMLTTPTSINDENSDNIDIKTSKVQTIKVSVKPKDVVNELERVPSSWSLEGLDEKIAIVKDKISLITESAGGGHTKREISALLECLENRKKYKVNDSTGRPFWEFFAQFDLTNDQKINILLEKYALIMQPADIFIPELPDDAVKAMKAFSDKVKEICDKTPRFFVIATEDSFKKNYEKRDPILLVQSPFGFYYHILGAWDKEMLYLPEL
ncbi:MAG: hypothetical protein Q7R33_01715 [Nitrosarchaeum sp.]|nr:hypothetical protein [Nitrosarchaeum sp.]